MDGVRRYAMRENPAIIVIQQPKRKSRSMQTTQTTLSDSRPIPGILEQHSTRMAFFIAGFAIAAWAPLVPYAKARLAVGEATLGLLLLCLGIGSVLTMPLTGLLVARYGCRRVIWLATLFICGTLPFLAIASTIPTLALVLLVFGAGIGTVDVAVNIQAIIVEKATGRPLMSGFHGMFSVGGIVGAGGVSLLLSGGVEPFAAMLVVAGLIIVALLALGRWLLPYGSERDTPLFVRPRGIVLFVGLLCLICFLAEGSILDWGAVFLHSVRQVPVAEAGWGFTIFSIAMTICRLTGDRIVLALGGTRILVLGGLLAAGGLALAVLAPWLPVALLGFAIVGVGAANIVPVLFSSAGKQTLMPTNLAVAAITIFGYAGHLMGPALIGFVAEITSLSLALLGIAVLFLLVTASARRVPQ
jgi:MFS family permease